MIIEGALYKLPELLVAGKTPEQRFESTLVTHFAMAILLELNARNIQQPMNRIHIERPYLAKPTDKRPARADLYVNLEGLFARRTGLVAEDLYQRKLWRYGIKDANWVEAKLFARIESASGNPPKVVKSASIAVDLLRLCLLVSEDIPSFGSNNRYLLAVFDQEPGKYLALTRRSHDSPVRKWLEQILKPGQSEISIRFADEPTSFHTQVPGALRHNLQLNMSIHTTSFAPVEYAGEHSYSGFLVRILEFEVSDDSSTLVHEDLHGTWSQDRENTQRNMALRYFYSA